MKAGVETVACASKQGPTQPSACPALPRPNHCPRSRCTAHPPTHLEARLPRKLPGGVGVDVSVVVKDVDELEVVALACHEIVGIVGGSDLHRACRQRGGKQAAGSTATGMDAWTGIVIKKMDGGTVGGNGEPSLGWQKMDLASCAVLSCAVLFDAIAAMRSVPAHPPVPKLMSTSSASWMIGMRRPLTGCTSILPCRCA